MARRRKLPSRKGRRHAGQSSVRRIERPIPGPDAFADLREPGHVQSQAATLLLIGSHLRGDPAAIQARAQAARPPTEPPAVALEALPAEDVTALGFPGLRPGPARFHPAVLERVAGVRFAAPARPTPSPTEVRVASRRLREVADAFYREPGPETAAALLEVSLRHPHELVRVSAAASSVGVSVDPTPAIRILERAVRSRDPLIRNVAANALARVDPRDPALDKLLASKKQRSRGRPSRTSTIVHGTWARTSPWWQPPAGDFWKYLHDNVDAELYAASDRFEWSGGYSDAARALAGNDLHAWVAEHDLEGLDLFTHSHGGSVAMLANQAGTTLGRLALLSCPVHWPKYMPDFTRVATVVSIRVHLDLVILADGGGQRFSDARIQEHVLPIWFDHFATHDPGTWEQYDVPAML